MKKIVSIALAVLMLLAAIPVMAVSAEENIIKIVDANGADVKSYATLQEAVTAVKDDQKILVLDDYTLPKYLTQSTYNKDDLRDIVIEGVTKADGTKPKITATVGFTDQLGIYNLTVRNLNIYNPNTTYFAMFMYDPYVGSAWYNDHGEQTLTIDNCELLSNNQIFKLYGGNDGAKERSAYNVVIKDSTVVMDGAEVLLYTNNGASSNLDIQNSTIKFLKGKDTEAGTQMFLYNSGEVGKHTVKISGNSVIECATNTATCVKSGMFAKYAGTLDVELGEGVTLYMNAGAVHTDNWFFRGTANITDNGATWKVSKTTLANGVVLPVANGISAWMGNGALLPADEFYSGDAEGDTVFSLLSADAYTIMNGAGYKEGGMAFGMSVSDAFVAAVGENAKFGLLIAPEEYAMFGFDKGSLNPGQYIELSTDAAGLVNGEEGRKNCILGFGGFPADNYDAKYVEISAIGFIEYEDANGEKVTLYTAERYTISYAELAAAAAK